jgi:hypothetical protein
MARPVRPVARCRVASCCQPSCWRRTSLISTPPWRSWIARNAAPASMAWSCCGSPTNTTFAPCIGGMGQHALHLARADHASLVDHQHVARCQLLAALAPLMFKAGNGARSDARPLLQTFGCNARQRRPANIVASALPMPRVQRQALRSCRFPHSQRRRSNLAHWSHAQTPRAARPTATFRVLRHAPTRRHGLADRRDAVPAPPSTATLAATAVRSRSSGVM